MSETPTMLACCRGINTRASSKNIDTNFLFLVSDGRMRLMATDFLMPPTALSAMPRYTSAIPPASIFSVMRYRWESGIRAQLRAEPFYPNMCEGGSKTTGVARRDVGAVVIATLLSLASYSPLTRLLFLWRGGDLIAAEILAHRAGPLGRLRLLFLLRLFLAVDAQRGHRPRQEPLEADGLATGLALV